jgi:hypothetical protein
MIAPKQDGACQPSQKLISNVNDQAWSAPGRPGTWTGAHPPVRSCRAVPTADCRHKAVITGEGHPNDQPQCHRINILLNDPMTNFGDGFQPFN